MTEEVWFRYVEVRSSYWDGETVVGTGYTGLRLKTFLVFKHTPKGVWIRIPFNGYSDKKFVLRDATKRFACPTPKEAMESLRCRKLRHVNILRNQVEHIAEALRLAEYALEQGEFTGMYKAPEPNEFQFID